MPKGRVGKQFAIMYTEILNSIGPERRENNSDYLLLFQLLVLLKVPNCSSSSDVRKHILHQMDRFKDEKLHDTMVEEAELRLKHRQSKLQKQLDDTELAKTFANEVKRGNLTKAVRFLTDREGGKVL